MRLSGLNYEALIQLVAFTIRTTILGNNACIIVDKEWLGVCNCNLSVN